MSDLSCCCQDLEQKSPERAIIRLQRGNYWVKLDIHPLAMAAVTWKILVLVRIVNL